MSKDMKRNLMRIAASMIACGVCLCAHGLSFPSKSGVKKSAVAEVKAVKGDSADAQYNLAQLYLNPHHPASRESGAGRRAISLLTRAAARGHAGAKAKLKELGIAVPQSSANVDGLRQRDDATFINNAY